MARKMNDRYVRFYTFGSAAAQLESERMAKLPKYIKPPKRKPIPFDPIAFVGTAVAVLLAVLMVVGLIQVSHTTAQARELQTQLIALEQEEQMLRERFESRCDLNEVRVAAESMGMIPAEEAVHISVELPAEVVEPVQLGWWDSFLVSLRQFFA